MEYDKQIRERFQRLFGIDLEAGKGAVLHLIRQSIRMGQLEEEIFPESLKGMRYGFTRLNDVDFLKVAFFAVLGLGAHQVLGLPAEPKAPAGTWLDDPIDVQSAQAEAIKAVEALRERCREAEEQVIQQATTIGALRRQVDLLRDQQEANQQTEHFEGVDLKRSDLYPDGVVPDHDVEIALRVLRTIRNVCLADGPGAVDLNADAAGAVLLYQAHRWIVDAVEAIQSQAADANMEVDDCTREPDHETKCHPDPGATREIGARK